MDAALDASVFQIDEVDDDELVVCRRAAEGVLVVRLYIGKVEDVTRLELDSEWSRGRDVDDRLCEI